MSKRSGFYPRPIVDTAGSMVVSQAGAVLLTETVRAVGLDHALSTALAPWRPPHGRHDPGKVLLDLAVTLAVGGDCLADIAVLRAEPGLFGPVASDPTVSRTVDRLAADPVTALRAIDVARANARARAWQLAGDRAPDHEIDAGKPLVIDVDATLVPPWCHPGHCPLGQGRRGADVQARVRPSSVVGVCRPRTRRHW